MAGTRGTSLSRYLYLLSSPRPRRLSDKLQIFYTLSSLYIIFLMTSVYARTREREKAWKFGMYCLLGSIVVAPFWYLIFKKWVIGHSHTLKARIPRLRLAFQC